jgi:uncharacterized protein YjeT (DUF2065 family)
MINWHDFLAALALVLVIEGIVPFVNPKGLRQTMLLITRIEDRQLRVAGGASMILGLVLLYFVRS